MSATTTGVGALTPTDILKWCEVMLVLNAAAAAPSAVRVLDCRRVPRRIGLHHPLKGMKSF